MTLLMWDPRYSVGIREIDQQHQRLFMMFNELYEAIQEGYEERVVDKILSRLIDYTVYHFDTEERLMRQHGYAGEAEHHAEHEQLRAQAKVLVARQREGNTHVSMQALKFMSDWLNHHILGCDSKLGPFLAERGVV